MKRNRWVYAIIGVLVLLMAGMIYAWSMMSKAIGASHPDWTAMQVSIPFTLAMVFFCLGGLIAGILSKRTNPRIVVLTAGICIFLGFFLASLTGESSGPGMIYFGFGVLCGLGSGFAYNTIMGTICAWFPDRQGMISGILLMGFGLSSFIVGRLYVIVTPSDGSDIWRSTFRWMGVIVLVVLVICCFFVMRPGEDFAPPKAKTTRKREVRQPAIDINVGRMIRMPSFWLIYIWAVMVSAAGTAITGQASGIATEVGTWLTDGTIATVVGLVSIMNGIGRVIYGTIFDRKGFRFTMNLDIISFLAGTLILLLALFRGNFALIAVGFLVCGFAYGGVTPMLSAIISDFYGRTNYSVNFSVIVTNLLFASFATTIAGRMYDVNHSYLPTIYMMLGLTVVGFLVSLGIRRPVPKEEKPAPETDDTES